MPLSHLFPGRQSYLTLIRLSRVLLDTVVVSEMLLSQLVRTTIKKIEIAPQIYKVFTSSQKFSRSASQSTNFTMRAVKQDEFGGPEKLYIGQIDTPKPASNQILVKVHGSAVNRADTLMCKGYYPGQKKDSAPETLGLEMAGKVHALGSNASKWNVGDRVMALLPKGGYAEFVAVNEDHAMSVPDNLDFSQASGIPEVWLTAYQLLHLVGTIRSGDHVLIHGGGSGVGTAAVQLVRLAGGIPIVTAGTLAKIEKCLELGAKAGFNYKEGEFVDGVMSATEGSGVDLILDCVGASFWKQNIKVLAVEGTWIVYGLLGGGSIDGNLLGPLLAKRGRLLTTTLKARSNDYKSHLVSEFTQNALPHFNKSADRGEVLLKPVTDKHFPLENVAEAHQYMLQNKNIGKVVLTIAEDA